MGFPTLGNCNEILWVIYSLPINIGVKLGCISVKLVFDRASSEIFATLFGLFHHRQHQPVTEDMTKFYSGSDGRRIRSWTSEEIDSYSDIISRTDRHQRCRFQQQNQRQTKTQYSRSYPGQTYQTVEPSAPQMQMQRHIQPSAPQMDMEDHLQPSAPKMDMEDRLQPSAPKMEMERTQSKPVAIPGRIPHEELSYNTDSDTEWNLSNSYTEKTSTSIDKMKGILDLLPDNFTHRCNSRWWPTTQHHSGSYFCILYLTQYSSDFNLFHSPF